MSGPATILQFAAATARRTLPDARYVAAKATVERLLHLTEPELAFVAGYPFAQTRRAIDVGANYGGYSIALAARFAAVEAFEPVARCARALAAYARVKPARIAVHEQALSAWTGEAPFVLPVTHGVGDASGYGRLTTDPTAGSFVVATKRLDDFGFDDVDFIKIDVEGHEMDVLAGASATIARSNPVILIELERRHGVQPLLERFAVIEALGYRGYFLQQRRLRPIAEFDVVRDQDVCNLDRDRARYVNNFFFVPH